MDLEVRRHGVDCGDPGNCLFKEGLEFLMAFGIDFSWATKSEETIESSESNILNHTEQGSVAHRVCSAVSTMTN